MPDSGHWPAVDDDGPDRVYAMEDRARALGPPVGDTGIVPGVGDSFAVTAESASPGTIRYRVGSGHAMGRGFWFNPTTSDTIDLAAPDASPRISLLTVRFDFANRTAFLHELEGTPAANPVAPEPVDEANTLDVPFAAVRVNPSDTGSDDERLTDLRRANILVPPGVPVTEDEVLVSDAPGANVPLTLSNTTLLTGTAHLPDGWPAMKLKAHVMFTLARASGVDKHGLRGVTYVWIGDPPVAVTPEFRQSFPTYPAAIANAQATTLTAPGASVYTEDTPVRLRGRIDAVGTPASGDIVVESRMIWVEKTRVAL